MQKHNLIFFDTIKANITIWTSVGNLRPLVDTKETKLMKTRWQGARYICNLKNLLEYFNSLNKNRVLPVQDKYHSFY